MNCFSETIPIVSEEIFQENFELITQKHEPLIIRGLGLGTCVEKWSPEFLAKEIGECKVQVHVSQSPNLSFINKNFSYMSLPFRDLVQRASETHHKNYFISENEFYYLRSLGEDPRRDVADIRIQFPILCKDIKFPESIPTDKIFSSVFRIASAGLVLWTHYDVMDNLLIQVKGRKQVTLFPPTDALNMYLNGDKSEVLDIDNPDFEKFPNFKNVHRRECILETGDVLYIPALWFHNVKYLEFGIAVNVFWKELDESFYNKKDPYGNKDHLLAQQAFATTDKLLKSLSRLPPAYKNFYCQRLMARIKKEIDKMETV